MSQSLMELARTNKFDELENKWLEEMISNQTSTEMFLTVAEVLRSRSHGAKAASLLAQLVDELYDNKKWKHLEVVLFYCSEKYNKMRALRERSLETIRTLNPDNALLDVYFKKSGLDTERDLYSCWKEFNTYYYLVPGSYVLHANQFGAGVITAADPIADKIEIDFYKKKGHQMGLQFSAKVLFRIANDHYYAHMLSDTDKMISYKDSDPVSIIKIVANSYGGEILASKLKEEVCSDVRVPALFEAKESSNEFANWWTKARKLAAKDKYVTITTGAKATISVREHELSYADEASENISKAVSSLDKIVVAKNFIKEHSTDEAETLLKTLAEELAETNAPAVQIEILSALIDGKHEVENYSKKLSEVIESLGDPIENNLEPVKVLETPFFKTLGQLKSGESKKTFLRYIREKWTTKWPQMYTYCMHVDDTYTWSQVTNVLRDDYPKELQDGVNSIFNAPDKFPGAFLRLIKDLISEKTFGENIPTQIEALRKAIFVLEIESVNPDTKVMQVSIPKLFAEKKVNALFLDYLQRISKEDVEPIFRSLTSREENLESKMRANVLRAVSRRFPTLIKKSDMPYWEKENITFMLADSKKKIESEVQEIVNVRLPDNAKAIGEAQALGDLSENAEFDAAKEEREKLNRRAQLLKELLSNAVLIESINRAGDRVELGTKVKVKKLQDNSVKSYSILGSQEANNDSSTLNYKAPFAWAMLGKRSGDVFKVQLDDGAAVEYEIEEVEVLNF